MEKVFQGLDVFKHLDDSTDALQDLLSEARVNKFGSRRAYFLIIFLMHQRNSSHLVANLRDRIQREIDTNYRYMPVIPDVCKWKALNKKLHIHLRF